MLKSQELDRIRSEYADREKRLSGSDLYSLHNSAYLFAIQMRQAAVLSLLKSQGIKSFEGLDILELGCGEGGVLLECLSNGAEPDRLHGIDLLPGRITKAHETVAELPLACANGENLPYPSGTFDLVLQFTVFTSILDRSLKAGIAQEMLRVVRKPQGAILWYDFWINPTNKQTKGIRPKEIQTLFPDCRLTFRRITLAPPIARRVVPISRISAEALEKLKVFNSHYLAFIQPFNE